MSDVRLTISDFRYSADDLPLVENNVSHPLLVAAVIRDGIVVLYFAPDGAARS